MNKLNKQDLRKLIKFTLFEQAAAAIPGDAPGEKQVHVFDFDDTLGVTDNPNGVMPYMNGQPMLKSEDDAKKWLQQNGLQSDLLAPKDGPAIKNIPERDGYAVYLSSAGLAKIQSKVPKEKQKVTGFSQPDEKGDSLLIDFTPSSFVDQKTTKPIKQTIDKLKQANSMGAKTAVMTARKGEGTGINFSGEKVPNTNSADIDKYLSSKGAKPNAGVLGVSGQNKGDAIKKKFDVMNPEEIHFYDDLSKNTAEVGSALETNKDTETFIYGPGEFARGAANANKPNKIIPKKIGETKMKITHAQLKKIIKEELKNLSFSLKEAGITPDQQEMSRVETVPCEQCESGFIQSGVRTCPECSGTGGGHEPDSVLGWSGTTSFIPCKRCRGEGKVPAYARCEACNGTGTKEKVTTLSPKQTVLKSLPKTAAVKKPAPAPVDIGPMLEGKITLEKLKQVFKEEYKKLMKERSSKK